MYSYCAGPEWKERKRFFLRALKDFGFGAKSEETVVEEAGQLIQHILNTTQQGEDYVVKGIASIDPFCNMSDQNRKGL